MGQIMGVQQLFGGITRFLGPIWSTWLFGSSVMLPFWAASAFMLSGGVLTWRIRQEPRTSAEAKAEAAAVVEAGRLPALAEPCPVEVPEPQVEARGV
jgi:hypothetical protein